MKHFLYLFAFISVTVIIASCSEDYEFMDLPENTYVPTDYRPFVVEGKKWYMRIWNPHGVDSNLVESYTYYWRVLKGDTLIQGRKYKKVYTDLDYLKYGRLQYLGAVREQGTAVSYLKAGSKKEDILYDFGIKKGDVIPNTDGKYILHDVIRLSPKDEFVTQGSTEKFQFVDYRAYIMQRKDGMDRKIAYIEGIGGEEDFAHKGGSFSFKDGSSCYIGDNTCVFFAPNVDWSEIP